MGRKRVVVSEKKERGGEGGKKNEREEKGKKRVGELRRIETVSCIARPLPRSLSRSATITRNYGNYGSQTYGINRATFNVLPRVFSSFILTVYIHVRNTIAALDHLFVSPDND